MVSEVSFELTYRYARTAAVLGETDETTMITLGLEHAHWRDFFRFCIFFFFFKRETMVMCSMPK